MCRANIFIPFVIIDALACSTLNVSIEFCVWSFHIKEREKEILKVALFTLTEANSPTAYPNDSVI